MPDRIIRDELFRSARFVRLTSDTIRLLFIGFLLHADDLANAEATTEAVEDILHRDVPDETVARWISELQDSGLIGTYTDPENPEKRLIHIPRFRQRLRYVKGRHPTPPPEVESKEIKELREKVSLKTDRRPAQVGLKTAEVKRSEEKRSEVIQNPRALAKAVDNLVANFTADRKPFGNKFPENQKQSGWWKSEQGIDAKARELAVQAKPGESYQQFSARLFTIIAEQERGA